MTTSYIVRFAGRVVLVGKLVSKLEEKNTSEVVATGHRYVSASRSGIYSGPLLIPVVFKRFATGTLPLKAPLQKIALI